jgi:hypothetical protein
MTIDDGQPACFSATVDHLYCRRSEPARSIESHTSNVGDLLAASGTVKTPPDQTLRQALRQRAI